jgi:hypothetical protein
LASKKFSKYECVYCQKRSSTPTGDHVFARQFFLERDRNNLPKVPSCKTCGTEKSRHEHYLTSILPFGGRHNQAFENLRTHAPRRLARNLTLHRQLAKGFALSEQSGQPVLPFEFHHIEALFEKITIGLLWHSWRIYLPEKHQVRCAILSSEGVVFFNHLLQFNAKSRISRDVGNGTFYYHGALGEGSQPISVWKYTIYGGLEVTGDPERPYEVSSSIGCITGSEDMFKSHPFP